MSHKKSKLRAETPHHDHHGIAGCSQYSVNAVSGTTKMKRSKRVMTDVKTRFARGPFIEGRARSTAADNRFSRLPLPGDA